LLIERTNLSKHILPALGRILVSELGAEDISRYQQERLGEQASPKTINLEVGTIRAILRRNRVWANIQQDVRMLPVRDDVGRAIGPEEEARIKAACLKSRSRCLYPVVVLALNTGMRYSDVRLLQWKQVDFASRSVRVGKSKTSYSSGRVLPLNSEAYSVLQQWAAQFPMRLPEHFLFPAERYGASGDVFKACAYATDPTKPIGSFKKAWEKAKGGAKVTCRFHDLRHTAATRMLEAGVPFAVLASIMGWSPGTTVRMAKRYGHIGQDAQRQAVAAICKPVAEAASHSDNNDKVSSRVSTSN
jgi:integrase